MRRGNRPISPPRRGATERLRTRGSHRVHLRVLDSCGGTVADARAIDALPGAGFALVLDPHPTTLCRGRRTRRDLGLRPAEPVALLVRHRDGHALARRRWAERVGGDRCGLAGRELWLEHHGSDALLQRLELHHGWSDAAGLRVRARPRLLRHGRVPRSRIHPDLRGVYTFGDY
jgi:hypothetical protein